MNNIIRIRHMKIKFLHLIQLESFVRKDDKLCLSAEFPYLRSVLAYCNQSDPKVHRSKLADDNDKTAKWGQTWRANVINWGTQVLPYWHAGLPRNGSATQQYQIRPLPLFL